MASALALATALCMAGAGPAHGLPPIPVRRQVLPPVPGYIPVYIQHGDVAPEDTVELADLFRVAGDNLPPVEVVSDALFGTPTIPSSHSSNGNKNAGHTSVSDKMSSQSPSTVPTTVQDAEQPPAVDKESGQGPPTSEHGTSAAVMTGLAHGEVDNAISDPAIQPDEENSEMHEVINLEPFPDKVEIDADKLIEMIDASKMDAEESNSNNPENTSPAFEGSADSEMPTTEEIMTAK